MLLRLPVRERGGWTIPGPALRCGQRVCKGMRWLGGQGVLRCLLRNGRRLLHWRRRCKGWLGVGRRVPRRRAWRQRCSHTSRTLRRSCRRIDLSLAGGRRRLGWTMFRQRSSLGGRGWSWRRSRTRRQRRGGLHQGGLVEEPCARQRASPQPSSPTRGRQSTSNGSFCVIKEPAACTRERSANQPAACLGRGRLRRRAGRRRLGLRGRVVRRRRSWRGLAACSTNVTDMWRHTQLQHHHAHAAEHLPVSGSHFAIGDVTGQLPAGAVRSNAPPRRAKPRVAPATCSRHHWPAVPAATERG